MNTERARVIYMAVVQGEECKVCAFLQWVVDFDVHVGEVLIQSG